MQQFTEFLAAEGLLSQAQVGQVRAQTGKIREPMGSIAFSHGLISVEDVDLILSEQRREHRPFGEIATEMGILTRSQVEALVHIQHTRTDMETAEALALAGIIGTQQVLGALGRFLINTAGATQRAAA